VLPARAKTFLFGPLLFLLLQLALAQARQKSNKETRQTQLRIEVTAGEKNEPVENASVYVRYVEPRRLGKDKKIEMNLKTNRDGVAKVPAVPQGKILVQVVAPGWKTFGQWYEVETQEQTIKIKLRKPPRWY
jgi:hypothetical protein